MSEVHALPPNASLVAHDDVVQVHFLATSAETRRPTHVFTVPVDRFVLSRATGNFFSTLYTGYARAMAPTPRAVHEISITDAMPRDMMCREAVQAFFDLVGLLTARALSSDALPASAVTAQKYLADAQALIVQAAYHHILALHTLADFFGSIRITRWIYTQLPRILDADMALEVIAYCLDEGDHPRPMARDLLALVLMWARCVRSESHQQLDARLACLSLRELDGSTVDVFAPPALQKTPGSAGDVTLLQGHVVKCMECSDYPTSRRVELQATTLDCPLGYWSAIMEEARSASGGRWLTLRRIPRPIVHEIMRKRPVLGLDETQVPSPQKGYYLEHLAARAPMAHYAAREWADAETARSFECSVSMCFVRKGSRTAATLADMSSNVHVPSITHSRVAVPISPSSPSVLWHCKIALPSHCRPVEYYEGECQYCNERKPVSIVSYKITIRETTPSAHPCPPLNDDDDNNDESDDTCSTSSNVSEDDPMDLS